VTNGRELNKFELGDGDFAELWPKLARNLSKTRPESPLIEISHAKRGMNTFQKMFTRVTVTWREPLVEMVQYVESPVLVLDPN
jgi:hypothetical protein